MYTRVRNLWYNRQYSGVLVLANHWLMHSIVTSDWVKVIRSGVLTSSVVCEESSFVSYLYERFGSLDTYKYVNISDDSNLSTVVYTILYKTMCFSMSGICVRLRITKNNKRQMVLLLGRMVLLIGRLLTQIVQMFL